MLKCIYKTLVQKRNKEYFNLMKLQYRKAELEKLLDQKKKGL